MFFWAKYGTQTVFSFPMVKRGVVDLAATADWTPATGDTKISKDQGSVANTTNNPAAVAGTGSVDWKITLTATELQAAEVVVQIVDSATKAVEDQFLIIYTYGNASGKIQPDWSDAVRMGLTALPNANAAASGGLLISGSNSGTTTFGALTVTGATTLTGNVALADGLSIAAPSTLNRAGLSVAGNGTGAGMSVTGGATGIGLSVVGGGTSGDGIKVTTTSGHGVNLAPVGTSMHGLFATGGNGGTSDGIKAVAGTGGVPIRGSITGDITGNLSGSVGSVTGAVGSVTGAVGSVTGAVGSVTARVTANTDQLAGQTVSAAAGVTFPASVASPTNITAGTITTVTNLTNAPTAGDFTATMKASAATAVWTDTTAGDFTVALSVGKSVMNGVTLGTGLTVAAVSGAVGSVTGAVGSVTGAVGSVTAGGINAADKTGYRLSATGITDIRDIQLLEVYAADGSAPTLNQAIMQIQQFLTERAISGTTLTVKGLDGSTSKMTFTLDSATSPTTITRAS